MREYYDTVGQNDPVSIVIPKGAYRAVFNSGKASRTVSAAITEESSASPHLLTSPQAQRPAVNLDAAKVWPQTSHRYLKWWIGLIVAGILVLVTLPASRRRQETAGPIHSVAVLPLQNLSGNVQEEYFVDGMTDALITELAHTPNLRVVSRTSVMREKGNKRSLRQIASALDVDAVVEGSVVRSKDRVRITAQLIDTRDDRHLWAQSYEEQMTDILSLQDKVVREIALQTQAALAPRERVRPRHIDPAAYDASLRGLYFLHQRNVGKSVAYLEQSVALDPSYAAAYAGLAEALATRSVGAGSTRLEDQFRALTAAKRAVALDGESGEAYAALGLTEMNSGKDWIAAGRDLEKGIALSPNNSLAEMQYSIYLDAMGRPEDAVSHMRRALQLDPDSFLINRHLGSTLYLAHHYHEALRYLQRAEEMEPARFGYVEEWITRCYELTLHFDEAVRADLRDLSATFPAAKLTPLRQAYRHGGWTAYERARIDLMGKNSSNGCDLYDVGESYLRLGDTDRAFLWLRRGAKAQCYWADLLPVDPILDGIRSDPRFSTLLQLKHLGPGLKAAAH